MASTATYVNDFRTGYRLQLVWTALTQNVTANSTTVEVKVQLVSTGASYTINSSTAKTGTLTVNGTAYTFSFTASLIGGQTKTLVTKTMQIPHSSDGSKTVAFSAKIGLDVTLGGVKVDDVSVSGSGTFDPIPRASTPSLGATSTEIGKTLTISTNRASSDFTHTLTYRFGGRTGSIATGIGASYVWTLPMALCDELPTSTSGKGTIVCETFLGGTSVGRKTVEFTATVPESVVPTIDGVSVSEAVDGIAATFGGFVQGRSKLAVAVTRSGARGSVITLTKTFIEGVEYRGTSFTSATIQGSGELSMTTVVTDSRGRTAQVKTPYTVAAYSAPDVKGFAAFRCDASGAEDPEGDRLRVSLAYAIEQVGGKNLNTYTLSYRRQGVETWTTLTSGAGYDVDTAITTDALFGADYAHELMLEVEDSFVTVTALVDVPTASVLIDFRASGKGIAFGKVSEKDLMEIAMDVELTGRLIQETPKTPTLLNGWTDYNASYYAPASYWKDSTGVVHLSGMIKGGAVAAGTVLFTLPEGYRPERQELFATVSVNLPARVDVAANGSVFLQSGGNTGWLSLCGISFRAKEV